MDIFNLQYKPREPLVSFQQAAFSKMVRPGDGKITIGGPSSNTCKLEDHFGEGIMLPCGASVAGGGNVVQGSDVQHLDVPNNLVPLMVKQITLLTPSAQYGGALSLHGMPIITGRLVGMMRNRQDLDSEIVFDFDDGTGRIKARIWSV
ncbi:uncharacterized protein [Triticum aestivum]|uniref:uncharacterized protein n=1 Tax=Triticum aestivum TaxID=4565 RepID=UPI001D006694|nr:uncharacterized protein LOC123136291 [Triticum aestivum]